MQSLVNLIPVDFCLKFQNHNNFRIHISAIFSLPIAIVTLTSEDDPDKEKLTSGSNQVRVMESSENETTKERLVLVTIQSENSQVKFTNHRMIISFHFIELSINADIKSYFV
jgi:hypothetical protein